AVTGRWSGTPGRRCCCAAAPEARRKLPPAQRRRQRPAGSCVPENDQLRSTGLNPVCGSDSIAVTVRGGSARARTGADAAMDEYDYIVVGAGSAGCVMAARLSEGGRHRVLLLEAGPEDRYPWIHVPIGYAKTMFNPALNWMFRTDPDPGMN